MSFKTRLIIAIIGISFAVIGGLVENYWNKRKSIGYHALSRSSVDPTINFSYKFYCNGFDDVYLAQIYWVYDKDILPDYELIRDDTDRLWVTNIKNPSQKFEVVSTELITHDAEGHILRGPVDKMYLEDLFEQLQQYDKPLNQLWFDSIPWQKEPVILHQ